MTVETWTPKITEHQAKWIRRLIEEVGWSPYEATECLTGWSEEVQRRAEAMVKLRGEGYVGSSLRALVRAYHRDLAHQAWVRAETDCNGYLLSRAGQAADVDPSSLFVGSEERARQFASDELLAWWDQHGRMTVEDLEHQLVWGSRSAEAAAGSGAFLA